MPFENEQFDTVTACQTIHHYGSDENRLSFFKEALRVLKPGGVLVVNHSCRPQAGVQWYCQMHKRVQ